MTREAERNRAPPRSLLRRRGIVRGDDLIEGVRGLCGDEAFPDGGRHCQAAQAGEGLDVLAGLLGGADEQGDELHRGAVHRTEVQRLAGPAEGDDQLADRIGFGVGDGESATDAGSPLGFAFEHGGEQGVALLGGAGGHEQVHQLGDGGDLFCREERDFD